MQRTFRLILLTGLCCLSIGFAARGDDSDAPAGPFNPPKGTGQDAVPADGDAAMPASPGEAPHPPDYLKKMPQAAREAKAAIEKCKERYLLGEFKTHIRLAACINPAVALAYQRAGYPYMDLLAQVGTRRLMVARQLDSKTLTDAQADADIAAFSAHIAEEERRRNQNPGTPAPESE